MAEADQNLLKLKKIRDYFQERLDSSGNNFVLRCGKAIEKDHYVLSFSIFKEGALNLQPENRTDYDIHKANLVLEKLKSEFGINATIIKSPTQNAIKISPEELQKENANALLEK